MSVVLETEGIIEGPNFFSCPLCDKFKNSSGSTKALRFHMHHHYKESFMDTVNEMLQVKKADLKENEVTCHLEKCHKRIQGGSKEGLINSIVCHLAMQHQFLQEIMKTKALKAPPDDPFKLKEAFITTLFSQENNDDPKKSMIIKSMAETIRKTIRTVPMRRPHKPKPTKKREKSPEEEEDKSTDESDEDEEAYMRPNPEYIRKRKQINLTEADLLDDDSDDEDTFEIKQIKVNIGDQPIRRSSRQRKVLYDNIMDDDDKDDDVDDPSEEEQEENSNLGNTDEEASHTEEIQDLADVNKSSSMEEEK